MCPIRPMCPRDAYQMRILWNGAMGATGPRITLIVEPCNRNTPVTFTR